jgi:hypothetical protein
MSIIDGLEHDELQDKLRRQEALFVWFTNHLEVKPFEMGGQVVKDKQGDEKLETGPGGGGCAGGAQSHSGQVFTCASGLYAQYPKSPNGLK